MEISKVIVGICYAIWGIEWTCIEWENAIPKGGMCNKIISGWVPWKEIVYDGYTWKCTYVWVYTVRRTVYGQVYVVYICMYMHMCMWI